MPFQHGKTTRIFVDDWEVSKYFREVQTVATADLAEDSTFGNTDKTYLAGLADGTFQFAGIFNNDAVGGGITHAIDQQLSAYLAGTEPLVDVCTKTAFGAVSKMVQAQESQYQTHSVITDVVGTQWNLQADGGVDSGTVLHDPTISETTSGNSAVGYDSGLVGGTAFGGVGHLHLITNPNAGTSTFKIQHSTDNSTFVDLITFTSVVGAVLAFQRIVLAPTTQVNRYLRALWTLPAAGGAAFLLTFGRRYF